MLTPAAAIVFTGMALAGCAGFGTESDSAGPAPATVTVSATASQEMTDIEFFEYMKSRDSLLAMKNVEFVAEMAQIVCDDVPAAVKLVELTNSPEYEGDSSEPVVFGKLMTKMLAPSVRNYCPESIDDVPDRHR